jgi:hypothetical protein
MIATTDKRLPKAAVRLALYSGAPLLLLLSLAALAGRAAEKPVKPTVQFNRDIRPILSENCFYCHGPDKNHRQADLRLDLRDPAIKAGAIVPGNPGKSRLLTRVFATDDALLMPPTSAHKTLTPTQKALLKRWVTEGAEYQPHWAYISPRRPAVPGTKGQNPVDAFILAKLAEKKIKPSAQADRRTLIRRVSLDLIGIPPTPAEVEAFVADKSPNAYEKVVDRLLASPHYGERMAVPWLDVVRYADTVGFHGDQNQNAWPYRDYVVASFNQNKPFDKFTIEQIAGDLLPNATPEQKMATCFNRLTMMTREGGAQAKEYLAKYAGDRVRTVSMTWLGSTMGCAECHDHKFDPISTKDFYAMEAFFADVKQWGVYADYGYTPNPDLKGYNNDYPFPPEITVESRYLKQRIAQQRAAITEEAAWTLATITSKPAARTAFTEWRQASAGFLAKHPDGWAVPKPLVKVTGMAAKAGAAAAPVPPHRVEPNDSVVLPGAVAGNVEITVQPEEGWLAAVRLEALPHADNASSVFRQGIGAATLTLSATLQRPGKKAQPLMFRYADANFSEPRYSNGFEILGVHRGWRLSIPNKGERQVAAWLLETPIKLAAGDTLTFNLPNLTAGCVRVGLSPFVPEEPGALPSSLTALQAALNSNTDSPAVLCAYLMGTGWDAGAFSRAKVAEADAFSCRKGRSPVLVTEAVKPVVTRVLPRGNWQDETGEMVQPAVLHFLPGPKATPGKTLNRLDLAKWIVSAENPLTARVYVNRLWKQFFGNGLSGLVEDLGAQGEWPTHPELLDWLAVEFREKGWDVKHMIRLMVTSATYKQSSSLRPELRDMDPNNRLLASQNPRRLEAEFVRDNALAIAGMLNGDIGGPPVKPYQPEGYYANIQFPSRGYPAEKDDRQYRRGVYSHWQRTFLHPMLVNFDAPSREDCIAARTVANTPQQALTLLNDPSFVEAARVFAAHLLQGKTTSDATRLDAAYRKALGRPIKPQEQKSLLAFLKTIRGEYRKRPEDATKLLTVGNTPAPTNIDPIELASWATVCRVVLNLQETITRY